LRFASVRLRWVAASHLTNVCNESELRSPLGIAGAMGTPRCGAPLVAGDHPEGCRHRLARGAACWGSLAGARELELEVDDLEPAWQSSTERGHQCFDQALDVGQLARGELQRAVADSRRDYFTLVHGCLITTKGAIRVGRHPSCVICKLVRADAPDVDEATGGACIAQCNAQPRRWTGGPTRARATPPRERSSLRYSLRSSLCPPRLVKLYS
jgi:hypothetical protein